MPNYFPLTKYNKSLQGFHFELFEDTKVSAKYWTAAPELWQKPLSTCFSYSVCSYKTVKVHRLHWSGASGMKKKILLDVCFESFEADMTPIKQV